MMYIL